MEDDNLKTEDQNPREVDVLAEDVHSFWKKAFVFMHRKKIKTWQAVFIIAFVGGAFAALLLAVNYDIQTKSQADVGSVTLAWNANTESDLGGYKLYYGTNPRTADCPSGNYAQTVDVGKAVTYTVGNLTQGSTYYFSLTAYDTSGNESCFTPELSEAIATTAATCSFTYSDWGACQPDGTQSRGVIATAPTNCTGGTPVLTQDCTYVSSSSTCTSFTYADWGACQPDGTQGRMVTSMSPSGCTGGNPILSQACVYNPGGNSGTTCTDFTYSDWGSCQPDGTQTRTVATSTPSGCTGGTPILSQACTYSPGTCTAFTYSDWGACQSDGTQTRTVATSSPSGCTGGTPVLSQTCEYASGSTCTFTYSDWGTCTNGAQTRTVATSTPSGCTGGTPVLSQTCNNTTCTAFTYSDWGTCANGTQTRTTLTSSPSGCTGGNPVLTQSCGSNWWGTWWWNWRHRRCYRYFYSRWSKCVNGQQTRTVRFRFQWGGGCANSNPVLTRSCNSNQSNNR